MKSIRLALFILIVSCHSASAGVFDLPEPISVTLIFGNNKVTATQLGHNFAPYGVSNSGSTVVGYDIDPNSTMTGEGLTWRRGQKTQTILGGTNAVSWNGKAVAGVEAVSEIGSQPYRANNSGTITYSDAHGINHPLGGPRFGNEVAVSGDGRVVVGTDNIYGAYSWTEGSTPISLPGTAAPKATSFDGSVIAGQIQAFNGQPAKTVLWTKSGGAYTMQDLPLSRIVGVTGDGKAVIGADAAGNAMRWEADTGAVPLGFKVGQLVSISSDGGRILSSHNFSLGGSKESMIWDQSFGLKSLHDYLNDDLGIDFDMIDDAFGFRLDDPDYIGPLRKSFDLWDVVMSADGLSFAGVGPNEWITLTDGYSLTIEPVGSGAPVPEPSTLMIAGLVACGILFRRR